MDYYSILWQIFWGLAAVITVTAFLYSDKEKTVKLLLVWSLFWALQFAFLWALSGAFISIFSFVRTLLSKFKPDSDKVMWLMFFFVVLIAYYAYENIFSLFPPIATLIATYALFKLKDTQFRIALIIPTSLWLIYNYNVWSVWGTIREIIILILHIKVILLSLGFAYRKEIYTLNYDTFVYLYNNSISKAYILWKNFAIISPLPKCYYICIWTA